jgi:hypothetical protein
MLEVKLALIKKCIPIYFDSVQHPASFRLPNFVKFSEEENNITFDHISQLGEGGSIKSKMNGWPLNL